MKISELVRMLLDAGASNEQIVEAVRALEQAGYRGARKPALTTFVYALMDPREGEAFYIGITTGPRGRMMSHRHDPCSAAWRRIREIEEDGRECEMELLAEYTDRNEALENEFFLINTLPGLLNRDRRLSRVYS